jgi:hypothetical protein
LLFNFASEYTLTKVQEDKVDLKLNGTQSLLVCADDIKQFGDNSYHKEKHRNKLVLVGGLV